MIIYEFEHHYRVRRTIVPHIHHTYEIHLITSGEGWMMIDGVKHPVKTGSLFVLQPGDQHAIVIDISKGFLSQYVIHMKLQSDEEPFKEFLHKWYSAENHQIINKDTQDHFVTMQYDWSQDNDFLKESVNLSLKAHLYELVAKQSDQLSLDYRVTRIINYMKQNVNKKLSLDELAEVIALEKSYFNRWFKKQTGIPPVKYFMMMKLDVAKELLAEKLSNLEVATTLNFADEFHFCRTFKQEFGITPGAYSRSLSR